MGGGKISSEFKNKDLKMKLTIYAISIGLILSNINAMPIDEFGRSIYGHERDGGHTVKRHIGKSFTELRGRCNGRKINKFFTSYRYSRDAEATLYAMINLNDRNRAQVDNFQRNRGNGVRRNIQGSMQRGYSMWKKWWSGKGKGIDCRHLNEISKHRTWYGATRYTKKDEYNYLYHAKASLKFNHTKNRWYIQTSFPSK